MRIFHEDPLEIIRPLTRTSVSVREISGMVQREVRRFRKDSLRSISAIDPSAIVSATNPFFAAAFGNSDRDAVEAWLLRSRQTKFGLLTHRILMATARSMASKNGFTVRAGRRKSWYDCRMVGHGIHFECQLKSGTSWGNKDQWDATSRKFDDLAQNVADGDRFVRVLACAYGETVHRDIRYTGLSGKSVRAQLKCLAGRDTWEFFSGNPDLFDHVVQLMEDGAEEFRDQEHDAVEVALTAAAT